MITAKQYFYKQNLNILQKSIKLQYILSYKATNCNENFIKIINNL